MESNMDSQKRNALFQKLKPHCVKISQLAIRESDSPAASTEIIQLVNQVLALLQDQVKQNPAILDEKLAEYVFFPLYHVFRQVEHYPMSLVETCIKCLNILIVYGWRSKITPKLVQQILSLLTFIIDGVPGVQNEKEVPEETVLEAFRAQTALLITAGSSAHAISGLSDQETIPALGHGITVILKGIVDGATPSIQQEAVRTLQAIYMTLREPGALASFLPGTISSLAKVLSTPNRYKKLVLEKCLQAVQVVLTKVLSDMKTRSILAKDKMALEAAPLNGDDNKNELLGPAWLKATVAQVKVALSTIIKLRTHEAIEVRGALERLCVTLLDECHNSLSNCTVILVETAMVLANSIDRTSSMETTLADIINIYPELGETVKNIVYGWMSSLSRIMQAGDEDVKHVAIHNLSQGIELLRNLGIESSTLDDSISTTLRDCMVSLLASSKDHAPQDNGTIQLFDDTNAAKSNVDGPLHSPVLLAHQSQKRLRGELTSLLATIAVPSQQTTVITTMLELVRESTSTNQVAAFWLCFELVKASQSSTADADAFLDLSSFAGPAEDTESVFSELYAFSVQILDSHTEAANEDWRLEAMAMEVAAYAAQKVGTSFRPELIDVLFPITTFLGSENENLQQHAVATLNSLAYSCQYSNTSELIIQNVDYMVNSVALRLNTLDISPASTQVLLMMVRLGGPRLIPFLDDVVESIFGALENYHGYPIFVENLFSVLKELVDQAARQDVRLLTDGERSPKNHRKSPVAPNGLDNLLRDLDKRKSRQERDDLIDKDGPSTGHPKAPWKSSEDENEELDPDPGNASHEEKRVNSPTYQLLIRVATLTQHYLTSPTPKLRRLLLELLTTSSTILAADEEAFLPLVNATWPVIISRLRDPETFVTIEACHTLGGLCAAAGDFLSSRFKTEWGDGLDRWCRDAKRRASSNQSRITPRSQGTRPNSSKQEVMIPIRSGDGLGIKATTVKSKELSAGSLGQYASPVKIWEAVSKLLTAIVTYVRVDDNMFDEILDLLSDELEKNTEAREALEAVNADAVWLARYEKGNIDIPAPPKVDGMKLVAMELRS